MRKKEALRKVELAQHEYEIWREGSVSSSVNLPSNKRVKQVDFVTTSGAHSTAQTQLNAFSLTPSNLKTDRSNLFPSASLQPMDQSKLVAPEAEPQLDDKQTSTSMLDVPKHASLHSFTKPLRHDAAPFVRKTFTSQATTSATDHAPVIAAAAADSFVLPVSASTNQQPDKGKANELMQPDHYQIFVSWV